MQVEQDALSSSATSFSNEFSHQHSQSLTGSRLGDQNAVIYSGNPGPNAYMLFDYNGHSDSPVDYALRTLNEPPANIGIYSAQYSEPAQQFDESPPVQIASDMNPTAHNFSENGEINCASTNDSWSDPTFPYEHRSSEHPNSAFLCRSYENIRRPFNHSRNSIQPNSFGSDNNMVRSTVPNRLEQAPPDTPLHSMGSHLTPPRHTSRRGGKVAHGGSQGKPSETDQARDRRARKARGPARKGKNHAELHSSRIAKRRPSKKPVLEKRQYPHSGTIAACSLWLSQNSGEIPSEHVMSCLSVCFGSSVKPIQNWFRRNVTMSIEDEDTGYQTMRALETDIASLYQGNRGCKRKATSLGVRAVTSIRISRNEARPFACTSRCPKCFKDKAGWERHEEKNRVQRLWVCSFPGCRNREQRKRVWLNRKEHFINHISNHHPRLRTTPRDIDKCYVEIKSNFDKHCIFSFCDQIFHSWKERINHIGAHLRGPWDMSEWRDMDEEEKDTDATDASEDESSDSESDDLGGERDSDDTEDGAPGLGPSDSSHDHGADRLGGHPHSSAQRRSLNSHHDRHRGDASTGSSKYDRMTYGRQANPSVSGISLGSRFSVLSRARPRLNTLDQAAFCRGLAPQPMHQPMQIHPLRYLGRGSSAIVDEVKMKGYEVTFARKRILSCTQVQQRSLHREVTIMARLKHPHVIRFVASYQQMNSINYLIRPVADYNLFQYMTTQSSDPGYRSEMQGWFGCLASGLQYLHNSGVRHRDIKPSNMLLRDDKILYTDFGSSNIIPDDDSSESDSADFTERYAAPEVFRGHRGRAADVFALGCVYFEMVAFLLQDPLGDEQERTYQSSLFFSDAREQHMESRWSTNTGMAASMPSSGPNMSTIQTYCKAMMDPRPGQRPNAAEIARRIPAHVCCEEQVDIITPPKAAGGPGLRSSPTASNRTLTSHSCGKEVISLTARLASTSYTPWRGSRTILEVIPEESLRTKNDDPTLKATRQHGIKKRRGEKEELKENVISERTKRLKSIPCDETADVPRAVPLLVNNSDDGTLSDSSCDTSSLDFFLNSPPRLNAELQDSGSTMEVGSPSRCLGANTYHLPSNADHAPMMKQFLSEQDPWQEFLMLDKAHTRETRRLCVTGLLEDVRVVGVD